MDIGSISVALSSLRVAKDISQAMLELKSTADIQLKVIELQGQILTAQSSALDAQSEQYELKKKLSEAEAELVRLLQWGRRNKGTHCSKFLRVYFPMALKKNHEEPNQTTGFAPTVLTRVQNRSYNLLLRPALES